MTHEMGVQFYIEFLEEEKEKHFNFQQTDNQCFGRFE